MKLFFHQLRAEQLQFWRSREAAIFIFVFPPLLFLLLGSVYSGTISGHPAREVLLAGMLGYGAANTAFAGLGVILVVRRESGLLKRIRTTPLPAPTYLAATLTSILLVFALQAVLAWIVAAPFLVGMAGTRPFGVVDAIGAAIAAFGLLFEAIGDSQMSRFKADPASAGRVMDRGLWRYTRHPNYFGEACVWWGLAVMALAGAGIAGAWCLVSPLLMTVLLLKVSGVSLLEKDIGERRPAYRDYIARTNAFVPGWPRRRGSE